MAAPVVLLVEDHELLSSAVALALQVEGIAVESTNPTSDQALHARVRATAPTLIMLDLDLGGSTSRGEDLVGDLVAGGPQVVVVTGTDDPRRIATAIDRGAAGFVHKSEGFPALVDAVTRALAGEEPTSPAAIRRLRQLADVGAAEQHRRLADFERLTVREAAVLRHLTEGLTVEQIAAADVVSIATVRTQVRAVLTKLGVNSQVEAVALAYRSGWAGTG
jgi:DNA-binding NarL/FixJ family response regulator